MNDFRDQENIAEYCDMSWSEKDPEFRKKGREGQVLRLAEEAGMNVFVMRLRTSSDFVHACFIARSEEEALARLTLIEIMT